MLTVWCVCVGDRYSGEDVQLLRAMVERNLSIPFTFVCLSDRPRDGVHCIVPSDIERYPGWWAKLLLWRYATTGRHLYIDLDAVIVGALEPLLSEKWSAPANWAQSGHGGIQSSVMAWAGDYSHISRGFDPTLLHPDPYHPFGRYDGKDWWGDQGYLTALLGDPGAGAVARMDGVSSYKYHCQNGAPPEWARIVAFHGEPKPAQVNDSWVRAARSFTPT